MTVKYNYYDNITYEYKNILEIKDSPESNFFILKNTEGEIRIIKYEGINLIIDTDKTKLDKKEKL